MNNILSKLNFVKTCREEGLCLSECPGFLYIIMGALTVIVMIGTYYVSRLYYSEEIVIGSVFFVTIIMICGSFLIFRSVDEIANSRRKTLLFLQSIGDGLLVVDKDYKVIDINPVAEKVFDAEKTDVLHKEIKGLKNVFDQCKVSKKRICISQIEVPCSGKNNIYRTVTSKIIDTSGKWTGFVIVLQDITKEKEIDKMKTEFISVTAHELKTPINSIKWNLELLMNEKFQKPAEEEKRVLKDIYNNSSRLNMLVRDLLDISRLEQGRLELNLENVDILDIAEDVLKDFQREINSKNLKVILEREKLPQIKTDSKRLHQVFSNIIGNAVKFTPDNGSVNIGFSEKDKKFLQVSISDTGIGIPKREQSNIFKKFFRASNIEEDTKGTGLGLAFSKSLIELMGGKIWFKSEENKGTTFYFTLPII